MSSTRLRDRMEENRPAFGVILATDSPWFVEWIGLAGFDFVMIDAEHGPLSPASVEPMVRAADAAGITSLVRVPDARPSEIQRYLDIGVTALHIPNVESAADALAGVRAMRYPPEGERGLSTGTRAARFGVGRSPSEYMAEANARNSFLPTIESAAGVEAAEAIAAVDGVDGIAIGPGDLSVSLGLRGDRGAAPVQAAVKRVIAAARAHGKWVSLPAGDVAAARQALALGANIVLMPAHVLVLDAGRRFLEGAQGA